MTVSERALGLPDNRADAVRARRARKTQRVERAGRIETPKTRRKKTPRRRYNVTLSAERGAEMQFTAIPAGSIGTRTIAILIIILAIAGLMQFARAEQFKVGQVQVDGIEMLTSAQVRSLLGVEGKSLFFLDPAAVTQNLQLAAEVKSAQVTLVWPNKIVVQVEERLPMIEWNDAGRVWWLSSDGVAYVERGEHQGLIKIRSDREVLSVVENAQTPVLNPSLLRAAASLSKHLPQIQDWIYDAEHGLGFSDSYGWLVYFGTGGDMPMKVRIYQAIAEKLSADGIQAEMVSVEDQSAPYYAVR